MTSLMLNNVGKALARHLTRSRPTRQSGQVDGRGAVSGSLSTPLAQVGLTMRESEVMAHLAKGLLYKEIAERMNVSYAVVHKLQHRIFVKLQVSNRTQAVVKWIGNPQA